MQPTNDEWCLHTLADTHTLTQQCQQWSNKWNQKSNTHHMDNHVRPSVRLSVCLSVQSVRQSSSLSAPRKWASVFLQLWAAQRSGTHSWPPLSQASRAKQLSQLVSAGHQAELTYLRWRLRRQLRRQLRLRLQQETWPVAGGARAQNRLYSAGWY